MYTDINFGCKQFCQDQFRCMSAKSKSKTITGFEQQATPCLDSYRRPKGEWYCSTCKEQNLIINQLLIKSYKLLNNKITCIL